MDSATLTELRIQHFPLPSCFWYYEEKKKTFSVLKLTNQPAFPEKHRQVGFVKEAVPHSQHHWAARFMIRWFPRLMAKGWGQNYARIHQAFWQALKAADMLFFLLEGSSSQLSCTVPHIPLPAMREILHLIHIWQWLPNLLHTFLWREPLGKLENHFSPPSSSL